MIKLLPNQMEIEKRCPQKDRVVTCSQSVNYYTKPAIPFGKILCLESDICQNKNCEYHNDYQGEVI